MTRRITRQTKKNYSVYLSNILDFLYEERGVEKLIIIDLSCGTTSYIRFFFLKQKELFQ